jgi:hypothetical protein
VPRWSVVERPLLAALVIHLAARAATLGAIVAGLAVHPLGTGSLGGDLGAALGKSDGVWYLDIAHHGYGPPPPVGPDGSYTRLTSLAFFPLYPLTARAVAWTGLPYLGAALLVTLLAGCAAAVLIAAWARRYVGDRGALALVAMWELLPSSVVLAMAYSEALFVAAAAGCLLALQRTRWLTAAAAATIGGLTRPTGGGLVLAVWLAVVLAWRQDRLLDPHRVAAVVLAPLGLVVSLVHVWAVTGRVDGWFWVERTVWRSGFDGGASALRHFGELLTGGRTAHRLPEIVSCVVVVAAVAAAVWWWRRRVHATPSDAAYAGSTAVLAVGERSYFYVKPRLLLVAFPLLLPVARWLAGSRVGVIAVTLVPALAASLAYNAYLVVGWPKAL